MSKHKHDTDLSIPLESDGSQESTLPSFDNEQADEQLSSAIPVGWVQGGDQPECDPQDAHTWEGSLVARPTIIIQDLEPTAEVPPEQPPVIIGDVEMRKLRDLLFSVRDQGVYCPMCRCPEFSPQGLRSSHYNECSVGLMCEKLLRMYPKDNLEVKWRK